MSRVRVAWLVLVVLAFGLAIIYSLRDDSPGTANPAPLASPTEVPLAVQLRQTRAALDPCPSSLSIGVHAELACLGGGPGSALDGRGAGVPTLVNLYGSWCGPCFKEMPLLVSFHERAGAKVALVGVDTKDDPQAALDFAIDVGQRWPAVVDDDGVVLQKYGGTGVPRTLFVTAKGEVAFVKAGAFKDAQELDDLVREHLGVAL